MAFATQFNFSQGLSQHLGQHLRLLPSQMVGLDLLQCSTLELQQRVQAELLQNPVLNLNQNPDMVIDDDRMFPSGPDTVEARQEREYAEDEQTYRESIATRSTEEGALTERQGADSTREEKRAYLFECCTGEKGLYANLLQQLSENVDVEDTKLLDLCQRLCIYVDEQGYLKTPDEVLCSELECTSEDLQNAISIVQQLWPAGICARTPQECLQLQLKDRGVASSALSWRILTECANALEENDIQRIMDTLHVNEEDVRLAIADLRALDPYPGYLLDSSTAPVVQPDVYFERDVHGKWSVRLNTSVVPDLTIDEMYIAMRKDSKTSESTRKYLQDKIEKANSLINGIANRSETLVRVSGIIAERQSEFLESGDRMDLKPLTRNDIAEVLNMAESTVGRALDKKIAHAPWGSVQFDDFFVRRGKSAVGDGDVTTEQVRQRLRDLIAAEDKHKPLSDQILSEQLKAEGFVIERRTVAKYRDLDKIPSTSERRIRR